jgi:hypothetical protein
MAFMVPVYEKSEFVRCEMHGEVSSVPADCYNEADHGTAIERETGWFYRLSAPGYMDCTEWSGPFATEADARADCRETHDVDPETGDDLPPENCDSSALDTIARIMDGAEWNEETLDEIAMAVRATGRRISDVDAGEDQEG